MTTHTAYRDGRHLYTLGIDLRADPVDDPLTRTCPRCGEALPLDNTCDCRGDDDRDYISALRECHESPVVCEWEDDGTEYE